jgi:cytochrome c peroxidase
MALAMEQFMLSVVSTNSRYDKFLAGEEQLSESEERGRILFTTEYNPFFPEISGADCVHCHGGANFENDQYANNGLDAEGNLLDIGRQAVTQLPGDMGKFKVPSLRNVAVTAPYMHDGRFSTLREVIDFYSEGLHPSINIDSKMTRIKTRGVQLSEFDKICLEAFLCTLTDSVFISNPEFGNPFK